MVGEFDGDSVGMVALVLLLLVVVALTLVALVVALTLALALVLADVLLIRTSCRLRGLLTGHSSTLLPTRYWQTNVVATDLTKARSSSFHHSFTKLDVILCHCTISFGFKGSTISSSIIVTSDCTV